MGIRRKKSLLEQAGDTVASVAGNVVDTVSHTVGDVAEFVETKLGDVVESAKEAVAAEEPTPAKKGGKLKKVLLLGAVAAVGGVLFKKVKAAKNPQSGNWQASYVPQPPPAAPEKAPQEKAEKVAEKVADTAEQAKDNVTELADKAATKAADTAEKATEQVKDAVDDATS